MSVIYIILSLLVIFNIYVYFSLYRIKRRNRLLQAFVSGTIRAVSTYRSPLDVCDADELPNKIQNPIPFEHMLENIRWELDGDLMHKYKPEPVYYQPFFSWLKLERNIFEELGYENEGFCWLYYCYHDYRNKLWHSDGELMSEKLRAYLRDDIEVTKDNVGELEGEIGMFKDVVSGVLDNSVFSHDNIDLKLMMMFNHIDEGKRIEAKKIILERLQKSYNN